MSRTGLTGAFGIAPQTAKNNPGSSYYWYRAYNVGFLPVTDERPFPQEVGGVLTPTGAFRAGAFAAGGLEFTPRLLNDFGWILAWILGENPVTTNDSPESGVNRHRWTLDGSEDTLKWATVRTLIPGSADLGIQALDVKAASLGLVLPQSGLLQAQLSMIGRLFDELGDQVLYEDPSWTPAFEDFESVPVSTKGGFVITGLNGDAELPVVGLSVEINNALTTPQQEMVIGSYTPDDFTTLAKTLTFRATVKWDGPDDFQRVFGGGADQLDWSEEVFEGAANVEIQAPGVIGATATPYEIDIASPNVVWQLSPPPLSGANLLYQDLVGTAIKKGSDNFVVVDLSNGDETDGGFAWPT